MQRVIKSTNARRDIEQIWQFTAEGSLAAADKLVDRFDRAIQLLLEHPGAGPDRSELAAGLRSYPIGSYIIFYRAVPGGIEIVRFAHGARDLPELFRDEP